MAAGEAAREISTLKDFYDLMHETAVIRREIVKASIESQPVATSLLEGLRRSRRELASISRSGEQYRLVLDSTNHIDVDLSYEIGELDKDILYVEKGEPGLIQYLDNLHHEFEQQVSKVVGLLSGIHFNAFITDRDGTINNYCGRYGSSIQSAYNAVFVSRFSASRVRHPIVLTSAPIRNVGLIDVSVSPPGIFIHAASKGREFIDMHDRWHSFPIDDEKRALIESLEARLRELVSQPGYQKFSLIGSGFQVKFGQITLARQDISSSIEPDESKALLHRVSEEIAAVDPEGKHFRIEDTGLDIEVILTISRTGNDELKDFDKGDGVRYVAGAIGLDMRRGPHLVCGDTSSDVPMLQAAMDASPNDTYAVFVTRKESLAARIEETCPKSVIVGEPDALVTALNRLSSSKK